jgi:hypothetical protein
MRSNATRWWIEETTYGTWRAFVTWRGHEEMLGEFEHRWEAEAAGKDWWNG